MATNFEYISSVGALPVNLGRQQYGPLDGSSVFKSIVDLKYYILASRNPTAVSSLSETSAIYENASDYWKKIATRYAYVGQNVTVVDDSGVNNYKIVNVPTLEEISVVMSNDISAEPNAKLFKKIADTESVDDIAESLSDAISSKIFIRNFDGSGNELTAFDDLSVLKMTVDEYRDLVLNDKLSTLSNSLFVISADYINAYGTQVKNVGDATQDNDAVNMRQLAHVSSDITDVVSTKIFFKEYDNPGIYGDLSVVKVKEDDYAQILDSPEGANLQTIYIVSSENENIYGKRIINLSDGVDDYDAVNLKQLKKKVQIQDYDSSVKYTDLSIIKVQKDVYDTIPVDKINQDALYIVSSDYIDAYGGQVKNVADATQDSDAVNLKQLKKKIFIRNYDKSGNELTAFDDLSVLKMTVDEYKDLVQSDEISALSNSIIIISSNNIDALMQRITNLGDGVDDYDAVNMKQFVRLSSDITEATNTKIFFKEYDNPGEYNNLSVVKIRMDEYENLLNPDSDVDVDEHTIYFISSDNKNAYGEKIVNLADGTDPTDAINKSQLTNCLSGYPNLSSMNWNSISLSTLVDMVKFAFSQLGGGQVSY